MIRIVEVGPRDGLQNEGTPISTSEKLAFIDRLREAGLKEIEATSFVSPKWVPQLGDAEALWPALPAGPLYSALVPNSKGLDRALALGVERIALFTAASEEFTRHNVNMSVEQSLEACGEVALTFRERQPSGWIRGYVSTAFECPYAGRIDPAQTIRVAERLFRLGVDEVSLGDTIGVAVPKEVRNLGKAALDVAPLEKWAWHFHDTRGTALSNISAALDLGFRAFDSSSGGLGGCPYAPGAGGNVATEDLVYFLERSGIATGVNLELLAQASLSILKLLGSAPRSKAQIAVLATRSSL